MWERSDTVDGKVCCILAWNMCIYNFMLYFGIVDLGERHLHSKYLIQSP
jgi:hypothetical protein